MTTPYGLPREPRLRALRYWMRERRLMLLGWLVVVLVIVGALTAWQAGAVNPSPLAQPPTSFGIPGANLYEKGAIDPSLEVGAVGKDETRTYIIKAKGAHDPQPAVIFLHGFGSSFLAGYEPWISHLAREGLTVIFPAWQAPPYPTDGSQNPRANMFEGVKLAVDAVRIQQDRVAVIGTSAGGALAFDYAALGSKLPVPQAKLVYSIYPGRALPGESEILLPLPPVGNLPENTRVISLVSRKDRDVGTRFGKEQYEILRSRPDALRALVYVTEKGLGDHYAPGDTTQAARRVFWRPFDAELTNHLGIQLKPDTALVAATRAQNAVSDAIERDSIFRKKVYEGEDAKRPGGADADTAPNPDVIGSP
ncbi:MAG: alpha/beta fold hydrolase [Solirubrobacteraceae bacterium]|nr:alpha/beta fold hydrolase [Solirubrobacteraceae bacterium]